MMRRPDMVQRPDPGDEQAGVTTADQYAAAQLREWNTYVAVVPIDYYGVRAYNAGDPVPVSAVDGDDAWVYDDLVRRVGEGSPAFAESATVVDPAPPTVDPTTVGAPPVSSPTPPTTDTPAPADQEA
jgi:hypothetical protein